MAERIWLYDTTLRDGAQTRGVEFNLADKRRIAAQLDGLGVAYVEGGWPGANPTDDAFFRSPPPLARARLAAFGMTRRQGRSSANDPGLQAVVRAGAAVVTLVGKTSRPQVKQALGVNPDENLAMIAQSVEEALRHAAEVVFDAEHCFDGFMADPGYTLACLAAAHGAGARWVVLCDTNGGTLPADVARVVEAVALRLPVGRLGIHAHDDTGNAVANSLAAVTAGVRHVQGTLNGLGERCGNADLVTLIPTLALKLGFDTGVDAAGIAGLTELSRGFDEQLGWSPNRQRPYVGAAAFAHKAGLHASAVAKDPRFYEHLDPALVGNRREILVSDQAGRANLLARFAELGLEVEPDADQTATILRELKEREAKGYAYDGAAASFELLVRRAMGELPAWFDLSGFRVIDERRSDGQGRLVTSSEATIRLRVDGRERHTVAMGNGPVNALDQALRQALAPHWPILQQLRLVDYRVRILGSADGTAAVTRVVIETADERGRVWQTVGVSANIIDASWEALQDSIGWYLLQDQVSRDAAESRPLAWGPPPA